MLAEVVSENRFLKLKDAAIEISMSTDWVLKSLIYPKKIKAHKAGSRWLIDLESWRQYLDGLRGAA